MSKLTEKQLSSKLVVNGQEIELGSTHLENIIEEFTDVDQTANEEFFIELAKNGSVGIRQEVAYLQPMLKPIFDVLVKDDQRIVLASLVSNEEAAKYFNAAQVKQLVESNDKGILTALVKRIDDFAHVEGIDEIRASLLSHPEHEIRGWFATDPDQPREILEQLSKDPDLSVRLTAQDSLADLDYDENE